jgi:TRAP-type uncharacterized transport system substrate-binding protein
MVYAYILPYKTIRFEAHRNKGEYGNSVLTEAQWAEIDQLQTEYKEAYKSWKDLDGQEIAVHARGSGTEAIVNLVAKQQGIKFKNISYVPGSQVRALGLLKGNIKANQKSRQ